MTDYRPLDWDEGYDADDNLQWEAAGTVYSEDIDGGAFYYRVRPQLTHSRIVWMVDASDHEVVEDVLDEFETEYAAKEWCERNNRGHYDIIIGSIETTC